MNFPPTNFASVTWDTRFLELPPGKVLLSTHKNIPTRPTALVDLKFVEETSELYIQVVENKNHPKMVNVVARYNGNVLEICHKVYDSTTQKTKDIWYCWNYCLDPAKPPRFGSEEDALCWMVLLASDVGCPGQARADMLKARKSKFWTNLLGEIKILHAVSSVMLT